MNTIIGLLIIGFGSMLQSSSYVPIKKVKNWSWESFWLIQGVFAWLVFPYFGSLLAVPEGYTLMQLYSFMDESLWRIMAYGFLWGIGGLGFGLSMRYLGVSLGQSIGFGTCSAFGTLIPALIVGKDLFSGDGLGLLIGVSISIAGIIVIGYAGSLRSKNLTHEQKIAAVKDFALSKGLLVAILAGIMSACFSLGIEEGDAFRLKILTLGAHPFFAGLPTILLITMGGFLSNLMYCLFRNYKNKSFSDYYTLSKAVLINNILFCILAGGLWYSQFIPFVMGKSFFEENSLMMAFSWSILLSLNIVFSNVWGILLKEWVGTNTRTKVFLMIGMMILIISLIIPNLI